MKLSVSAYRAQAAAHKKILSNTNYQSGYSAGLSNPSASLASSILHAVPPTSPTTTQVDDDNECAISVTKSSLTSNNTMNSRNADQTNSDDQSVSLYCAKEDLNDKQAQKNKTNPRWIKLRTTVQISSAIQKKPSLKREDSFLKRFSTRPPAVTQETIEDTCSDGPTSEEGIKSWFYHPYQKKRKRKRLQNYHPISVVNPDQDFYFYWLFILTICVLYNLWTLIVRQSFPELQKLIENTWLACDTISDIVFVLDIVVQLRTGYLEQGLMVYNSRKLACHYLQSKSFIFDICALCPLDLLQIRFGTQPLLRFPRFLKVYRAVNYYYIVESRTVWPNLWRVANLIHILLILAHWFGCFYFLLSEVERFQGDWVYPYRPGDYSTLARKYLGSFYWATLTLTTIGDLPTPETNSEKILTVDGPRSLPRRGIKSRLLQFKSNRGYPII